MEIDEHVFDSIAKECVKHFERQDMSFRLKGERKYTIKTLDGTYRKKALPETDVFLDGGYVGRRTILLQFIPVEVIEGVSAIEIPLEDAGMDVEGLNRAARKWVVERFGCQESDVADLSIAGVIKLAAEAMAKEQNEMSEDVAKELASLPNFGIF